MESLRKPFFIAALVLMLVVVLIEIGATGILHGAGSSFSATVAHLCDPDPKTGLVDQDSCDLKSNFDTLSSTDQNALQSQDRPPGLGIPYMALLDGIMLFTFALMGAQLLIPERLSGRVQGCVTFVFSFLSCLGAIVMIFTAIALVILMVSLLLATPFGTLIYLAIYGFFDRGGARITLGLIMTLKIAAAVCLVLAQQRFLQNIPLVLLVLTSLVGGLIISFLQNLVPGFLVSITDSVAGIVVAILAVIWLLYLLIGSIPAILKALWPRV